MISVVAKRIQFNEIEILRIFTKFLKFVKNCEKIKFGEKISKIFLQISKIFSKFFENNFKNFEIFRKIFFSGASRR